ncbi:MAG TPA: methyltransferase domain-containing protein [Frankiaceae bacterium]|jgi:SAM-dependent methyltransferase/UDP-N-acetylglucosamine transferase subunit ALG13|nr:methyltransferase domain-containing protein [Frankiaceae bacterium]
MHTLDRLDIVVTVGMGRWPFDRLLEAVAPLCTEHNVFVQTGSSTMTLPCEQRAYVTPDELNRRLERADVVVTHAGNTVRLVQRMGKVPVAVARERARGEMADDHQVTFLRSEEISSRVRAVWDVGTLGSVVTQHARSRAVLPPGALAPAADPRGVGETLDRLWSTVRDNPFRDHPTRRYAYAYEQLSAPDLHDGPHLDIGCGNGDFAASIASTGRACRGVDAHAGYLSRAREQYPHLPVTQVAQNERLPFADGLFASVSLLDVLEHCADDERMLREAHRVLRPGGRLVLTVPARHPFTFLDPDNAKFRIPRVHRLVYSARFGAATYHERFVDPADGLIGDIALERGEHTNYVKDTLVETVQACGFSVRDVSGANLFWRLLHGPSLLAGRRLAGALDRAILLDGRLFDRANLFLTLEKDRT